MSIEVFEGDVRLAVHKAGRNPWGFLLFPFKPLLWVIWKLFLEVKPVGKAKMLCPAKGCIGRVIYVHRKAMHDLITHRFNPNFDIYKDK